jgi:hypothetical protein
MDRPNPEKGNEAPRMVDQKRILIRDTDVFSPLSLQSFSRTVGAQ